MLHPKVLKNITTSYYRHFEDVSGLATLYYSGQIQPVYYRLKLVIDNEELLHDYNENRNRIVISGLIYFYKAYSKQPEFAIKLDKHLFKCHRGYIQFADVPGEFYFQAEEFGYTNGKGFVP